MAVFTNPNSRAALNVAAKASKLTQSELSEILVRRYLPKLLIDMKAELGNANSFERCEYAAIHAGKAHRRVAVAIRETRIRLGWSQQKAADAIGWARQNYQKIEQGDSRCCSRVQASRLAKAFGDQQLIDYIKSLNWWSGD